MTCLDLGQSTGGFTDVLLQRGAEQRRRRRRRPRPAASALAADPRVTALEGVNARDLDGRASCRSRGFDLVVGDLSFISLDARAAGAGAAARRPAARLLVKPQFELQPVDIGPGGKVKDASAYVPRRAEAAQGVRRPTASTCATGSTAPRRAAKARANSSSTRRWPPVANITP